MMQMLSQAVKIRLSPQCIKSACCGLWRALAIVLTVWPAGFFPLRSIDSFLSGSTSSPMNYPLVHRKHPDWSFLHCPLPWSYLSINFNFVSLCIVLFSVVLYVLFCMILSTCSFFFFCLLRFPLPPPPPLQYIFSCFLPFFHLQKFWFV